MNIQPRKPKASNGAPRGQESTAKVLGRGKGKEPQGGGKWPMGDPKDKEGLGRGQTQRVWRGKPGRYGGGRG